MAKIIEADIRHIPVIQNLASETWWQTYREILSKEQIRFMLDELYSDVALTKAMRARAQIFILLEDEGGYQAFAAYGSLSDKYRLHKLYVHPRNHGKGYGKNLIQFVFDKAGGQPVELNVHRANPAVRFYEKMGFRIIREEDIPFGAYYLNDYIMQYVPNGVATHAKKDL